MKSRIILFLSTPVVLFFTVPCATSQDSAAVKTTIAAWENRQERTKTVRYTVTGTAERTPASLEARDLERLGASKLRKTPVSIVVALNLPGKQYRVELNQQILSLVINDYKTEMLLITWNGSELYTSLPKVQNTNVDKDPDVRVSSGNLSDHYIETLCWPLFSGHGCVPTVHQPLVPANFPPKYDTEEFRLAGDSLFRGAKCHIIRTDPLSSTPSIADEVWVNPTQDFAVVRHVYCRGSSPVVRIDTEYQRVNSMWLPKQWTQTNYSGTRITQMVNLSVTNVEVDPTLPENYFSLPITPGMRVDKHNYPKRGIGLDTAMPATERYLVAADGSLQLIDATGFTTQEGRVLPPEKTSRTMLWVIVAGTLVSAIVILAVRNVLARRGRLTP